MVNNKRQRLFENDCIITGIHGAYIKFLVKDAKLFDDYIDVYKCAAIIGYLYKEKSEKDTSVEGNAKIYADAFSNHRQDCLFLYKLITLLDGEALSDEEKVNRAFRYDADEEKEDVVKECMENFNAYVRGGIERMYKEFTEQCTSREDYIRNSFKVIKSFKDNLDDAISYKEKLKERIAFK